jgi:hypothetical protein
MSRIVSPHGPTQILITFNEQTGETRCDILDGLGRPKEIPFQQINAIFAQLIVKFSEDGKEKGLLGPQEFAVYRMAQSIIRFLKDMARSFVETSAETPAETPAKTAAGSGKGINSGEQKTN